eukprot:TRINITY_DN2721_c0_g1_i1.p1 TRINITY_DN2721_c0_g1~~TRINITY_DN2721_c0_g1_i1.p1  ORF type:complete len:540 (-),score=51.39 TRINITY_DN2721_c0_g1_i1:275-1894(-)
MIDYRAGNWGFHVAFGWNGSLAPRALTMAVPNAALTFLIATLINEQGAHDFRNHNDANKDTAAAAQMVIGAFTSVMIFILYNRSNTAYDRWWEGGTLLQKTRGEWFNAYSSIMAFTSTKPEMQDQVHAYVHLLARLMSLLMCCGLQQVSPIRDRPFEIIDLDGIEPASMEFLNSVPDKVEIILQWIQRSMVLHVQTGVLPVAPPILSRAFQEVSRGIVNLQNARKIADFPYPYPLAQVSMILQLLHWALVPIGSALAAPRGWAVLFSFCSIFVLWCIHFNALDLEFPFGDRLNDLPMHEMQQDWNKSIYTLLDNRATRPPIFDYDPIVHDDLLMVMSDASDLYVPSLPVVDKGVAIIKVTEKSSDKQKANHKVAINGGGRAGRVLPELPTDDKCSATAGELDPGKPAKTEATSISQNVPTITVNSTPTAPPTSSTVGTSITPRSNAVGVGSTASSDGLLGSAECQALPATKVVFGEVDPPNREERGGSQRRGESPPSRGSPPPSGGSGAPAKPLPSEILVGSSSTPGNHLLEDKESISV